MEYLNSLCSYLEGLKQYNPLKHVPQEYMDPVLAYLPASCSMADFMAYKPVKEVMHVLNKEFDFNKDIDLTNWHDKMKGGIFMFVVSLLIWMIIHFIVHHFFFKPISWCIFPVRDKKGGKAAQVKEKVQVTVKSSSSPNSHVRSRRSPTPPPAATSKTTTVTKVETMSPVKTAEMRSKFSDAGWKFVNYGILGLLAYFLLKDESWLMDFTNYSASFKSIPWKFAAYYHLAIASYFYGIYCLSKDRKLSDYHVMILHHIVTIGLLVMSYYESGRYRIGTVVMLLHDVCDPAMEIAKMFLYSGCKMMANLFFVLFSVLFIFCRDYIYPYHVLYPMWNAPFVKDFKYFEYYFGSLATIQVLDVFWSGLILIMMFRSIFGGITEDIREVA